MAIFDKLAKTAGNAKTKVTSFAEEKKLGEKFNNVKDSMKSVFTGNQTETQLQPAATVVDERAPLPGAYIRYEVAYLGGLPEYADCKHIGNLGINLMPDRFVITDTFTSRGWFRGYSIPYCSITDITLEARTVSDAEMMLAFCADLHNQQENNICISFRNDLGIELMLRLSMRTGVTIYKQAAKCREFMDVLRQYGIMTAIKERQQPTQQALPTIQPDILGQIEKLAQLRDAGILTEEEFIQKKTQLLDKL